MSVSNQSNARLFWSSRVRPARRTSLLDGHPQRMCSRASMHLNTCARIMTSIGDSRAWQEAAVVRYCTITGPHPRTASTSSSPSSTPVDDPPAMRGARWRWESPTSSLGPLGPHMAVSGLLVALRRARHHRVRRARCVLAICASRVLSTAVAAGAGAVGLRLPPPQPPRVRSLRPPCAVHLTYKNAVRKY